MGNSISPRALVDDLLEVSVIASFSRIGPTVRRPLFGWSPPPANALAGRTALVTGPTSGLGRQAAQELAALGARVVLVGRDRERLTALADSLSARHRELRFPIVVADMTSLASVRSATEEVIATESRLDVLIDNAGAIFHRASDQPRWHRGDVRDARPRPVHTRLRAAPAARTHAGRQGHRGHVRVGSTPSRSISTISSPSEAPTTGRAHMRARSGPRSR